MVHLGIIPDGNRRWCKENNYDQKDLVKIWTEKIKETLIEILKIKNKKKFKYLQEINELSFYICSIDNINRNDDTKEFIFKFIRNIKILYENRELFFDSNTIKKYESLKDECNLIINFIGDIDLLPLDIQYIIKEFKKNNLNNNNNEYKKFTINLAVAYDYNKDLLNYGMNNIDNYNRVQSDIDILFRSGKEKRISGFFPTKVLYSEFFFVNKYWPDIKLKDLNIIIKNFYLRNRRYGK